MTKSQTRMNLRLSSHLAKSTSLRHQHWLKVMGCSSFVFRGLGAGCTGYKRTPCYLHHYLCNLHKYSSCLEWIDRLSSSLLLECAHLFFQLKTDHSYRHRALAPSPPHVPYHSLPRAHEHSPSRTHDRSPPHARDPSPPRPLSPPPSRAPGPSPSVETRTVCQRGWREQNF